MFFKANKDYELYEVDIEDALDLIPKVEETFAFKFKEDSLNKVRTFGEFCDVVEEHLIDKSNIETCTSQQAFYKIQNAFSLISSVDKKSITPNTKLKYLFPKKNRKQIGENFKTVIGFDADLIGYSSLQSSIAVILFLVSLVYLFISFKIALLGFVLLYLVCKIFNFFSNTLQYDTIKELSQKLTLSHYSEVRRNPNSINKSEVIKIIRDKFCDNLFLDKNKLNRESKFS